MLISWSPYVSGFYRITFTILEPFRGEYYDRKSEAFQQLSEDLSHAVNELYESVTGRQSATVIQIQYVGRLKVKSIFTGQVNVVMLVCNCLGSA
jgi:hypothetical protein